MILDQVWTLTATWLIVLLPSVLFWNFDKNFRWLFDITSCGISDGAEYCSRDVFEAKCADDEVILMEKAKYGRMEAKRCINPIKIGCNVDVLGKKNTKLHQITGEECAGSHESFYGIRETLNWPNFLAISLALAKDIMLISCSPLAEKFLLLLLVYKVNLETQMPGKSVVCVIFCLLLWNHANRCRFESRNQFVFKNSLCFAFLMQTCVPVFLHLLFFLVWRLHGSLLFRQANVPNGCQWSGENITTVRQRLQGLFGSGIQVCQG